MVKTERYVNEVKCKSCNTVYLLGQTFNGNRCCSTPTTTLIGLRKITEWKKTIEEEKEEVLKGIENDVDL